MCFRFDSCFGGGSEDFGRDQPTPKAPVVKAPQTPQTPYRSSARSAAAHHAQRRNGNRGGGYYHLGEGHHGDGDVASYHHHHHQPADEARRKAYNDARTAAPPRGGHGYTVYAHDETLKVPAWNSKVGDDTGYKARLHEAADKENAMITTT